MPINITIVTNSYKRDKSLVLRSIEYSLFHSESIQELIFIDQNENSLSLPKAILANKKLTVLRKKVKCVSEARNSLPLKENCDWIVFCDDDGYMSKEYIPKFLDIISKNSQLEVIAGSIVRDDNFEFYSPRHKIGGSLKNFRHTKLLMGSNFAVRKDVFNELGGFDEKFGAGSYWGSGEETDFCWKAFFTNKNMEFHPELIVYHVKPYAGDQKHSEKKAFQYGIGKGALISKWLIDNKKLLVLFELIEMTLVPLLQISKSALVLDFNKLKIIFCSLGGRYFGLAKSIFQRFR